MDDLLQNKAIELVKQLYKQASSAKYGSEAAAFDDEAKRFTRAYIALFSGESGFNEKEFMRQIEA